MISVTDLTKNSQSTLASTLDSLSRFSEVIVLDSGSTDDTLKIAKAYPNVTVHSSPFLGFGPTVAVAGQRSLQQERRPLCCRAE